MIQINRHPSLARAEDVLNRITKLATRCRKEEIEILVKSWSNCREQGYALYAYLRDAPSGESDRVALIAMCRNSDSTLVVMGNREDFDIQTNQPNDKVWSNQCHYFPVGWEQEAAKSVLKWFRSKDGRVPTL